MFRALPVLCRSGFQLQSGARKSRPATYRHRSGDPEYQPGVGNGVNYWNTSQGGYVFITATGFNAASTLLLLYAQIPKAKPRRKEIGAATKTNESVSIEGFH